MSGQLDFLNCGAGHMEIRFSPKDEAETSRAKNIIKDVLKRGYALFVHGTDNRLVRVKRFDAGKGCYVIVDSKEAKKMEKHISMHKTKAVAVGRSAGG